MLQFLTLGLLRTCMHSDKKERHSFALENVAAINLLSSEERREKRRVSLTSLFPLSLSLSLSLSLFARKHAQYIHVQKKREVSRAHFWQIGEADFVLSSRFTAAQSRNDKNCIFSLLLPILCLGPLVIL